MARLLPLLAAAALAGCGAAERVPDNRTPADLHASEPPSEAEPLNLLESGNAQASE